MRWNVDYDIKRKSFLSWDEIHEMHKSGVIYFGSHTKSHHILTTIPDERIQDELAQSKDKLLFENVVTPEFIPFAYPNGNYNDRIAKMVEEAGYNLAVTTEKGWNSVSNNNGGLYKLKRIGIHQDMTSTNAMLACRIYGIY
jgi:peptidoglycan/xylan/chitin deacetylase (PgdA/CDA1 family)